MNIETEDLEENYNPCTLTDVSPGSIDFYFLFISYTWYVFDLIHVTSIPASHSWSYDDPTKACRAKCYKTGPFGFERTAGM